MEFQGFQGSYGFLRIVNSGKLQSICWGTLWCKHYSAPDRELQRGSAFPCLIGLDETAFPFSYEKLLTYGAISFSEGAIEIRPPHARRES
ncbi:hypothetical protein T03_2627 [Trichinella britovi]|uniref:Uncharacterized protein n=1 Tax=Trichinella britovi TaxID=45882 RepID=A0A0V1C408_TRIBR|nr:hypothetical protein T03_2627 [Trichinella britovi]